MYDKRLDLYGSLYEDPMNQIGQNLQQQNWQPSVSAVLAKQNQPIEPKKSNIPAIGSVKQAVQAQYPQNNPTLGYLGGEGNLVAGLTSGLNSFLSTKNQKDSEDKQNIAAILATVGKGLAL